LRRMFSYPGESVFFNGRSYCIPSLSARDFLAHRAEFSALAKQSEGSIESFGRFIPVIGLAIRRNYPDVTDEQLGEWLDLHTIGLAIRATLKVHAVDVVNLMRFGRTLIWRN
jgi:hypothetical protein